MTDYKTILDGIAVTDLEIMKKTINELCGVVLRLQVDLNSKPDLRDHFAMAALPAAMSRYPTWKIKAYAKGAYEIADAMMEARK